MTSQLRSCISTTYQTAVLTPAGGFVLNKALFNPAILIPVYNHGAAIRQTLLDVLAYQLPVLLVDDGSDAQCRQVLVSLSEEFSSHVSLLRLDKNTGKGAALKAGFKQLSKAAYSHALQVDADGQHNLEDIPQFIKAGELNPNKIICGIPEYDDSVPKARYYGRYLTHTWVWINSLSFRIKDSMCGFRLYPLKPLLQLLEQARCGNRMDFDSEIMVRWVWGNGAINNISTPVHYPSGGVSHFNLCQDNLLISWMHARLFFGMLIRLPSIIWRRF